MNDKIGGKDQLDIGKIITAPTKDKDWFKKCLVMGLMMLIPIAGALNLSGWMKAIADKHMAGGEDEYTLPPANLDYIGAGWRLFLAYLPLLGVLMFVLIGGAVTAGVAAQAGGKAGEDAAIGIIIAMYAGVLLLSLAISIIGPAITFLHVVDGEPWASIQGRRIWEVMKEGGTQYFLLFIALFIGGMIAQLGVLACYVGLFVSVPFAQAMSGMAIAEYAKILKPQKATFPIDGGAGGRSGDPFGVKI